MASEPLIVQAIYSFKGTNNDELCFKKGDKITITQKEDGGWWEGTLADKTGWFPSNYVKECKETGVNSVVTSNAQQKQYRAVVLKDLIDSEQAHVTEQQGLVKNFLQPLEKSTVLTSDEYRQLTGNLIEVLDTHQQLLRLIEDEEKKPSEDQRVGKLFLTWAPRIKTAHQVYCSLHPKAAFILDKYKDELTTYMESCGATTPGVLVLTIGLSKPFRRLEKYSGMLQELERHLEESHVDRGDTQRSVAVYKDIATTCSATRRQKELELQVLTGPVRGWEGQTLATLGDIIYMGSVAVGPQHHDRYLVLFPTTLLILSVSPRFSAFIYEGKLPLTGICVNRLEDSEQYKNGFEISGPLIEKRTAVCQSKEEANHWVELLRKHMPHRSNAASVNQKVSPSQAEIVPQPPPHLDNRGYCNRTSVLSFNYEPRIPYKAVLPPISYPPAAPYVNLNRYYRKLVKNKAITNRLMKKLLYPEYINKKFDLSCVKRRHHKTECVLIPDANRRASVINCDSDSDSTSSSGSENSDDKESKFYRQNALDKKSSSNSSSSGSGSSSNPFGYIRYYNPQTGEQKEETKYESVIDYGEIPTHADVAEAVIPVKTSIVLTSTAKVQLVHQSSETSEQSSVLEPKPYMACEDLVNIDSDMKIATSISTINKSHVPKTRQSLPPKFVANKFSENSLTTIYIPPWQSSSDHNLMCRSKFLHNISEYGETSRSDSSSTSTTTHSSSIDLAVNPVPLPDAILAELLYNSESTKQEDERPRVTSRAVIKPPTMFRNTQEGSNLQTSSLVLEKPKRRSSIQINTEDVTEENFNPLRRCLSYQLVQVSDPTPSSSYMPCCRCMGPCQSSPRSSDSGMAGSCTLNSPDFPTTDCMVEKRHSSESLNIYNNEFGDLNSLGGNIMSFSEIEARKFESQCQCTSPFGSTPRTSCQPSISENIVTGAYESMKTSHLDLSGIPTPHPWESENLIHSKLMEIRTKNSHIESQRCEPAMDSGQKSKSVGCILDDSKIGPSTANEEQEKGKNETFRSGLYAHWWLKAKIPPEVIRGIYEETRSPTAGKGTFECNSSSLFGLVWL